MNVLTQFEEFKTPIGGVTFRPLVEENDHQLVAQWVQQEYASFWGMTDKSDAEVKDFYQTLMASGTQHAYLGVVNGAPQCLIEVYQPSSDAVGKCYEVSDGDIGMHIMLAPASIPMTGFSHSIMRAVMNFMFKGYQAKRVVVEPDIRNHKVHRLNAKVGFVHERIITMGDKTAFLGFCSRDDFEQAEHVATLESKTVATLSAQQVKPMLASAQLNASAWQAANRHLVKKMICEFSHERLISPIHIGGSQYQLAPPCDEFTYQFDAQMMQLSHLQIDVKSIVKIAAGTAAEVDALEFVIEFHQALGMSAEMLGTYLEEVSSTLLSSCYKAEKDVPTSKELTLLNFQDFETTMSEGHPTFVANNGRIGFNTQDYHHFAPEAARPFRILWLAASRQHSQFSAIPGVDYDQLIAQELDISLTRQFDAQMQEQGLELADYYLFPVHPWQWFNKLCHLYSPDIAKKQLVCLGYGDDAYLAQQSIRTLFNISQPSKYYVKTALSILNMGFMRGLSAKYMEVTPAINQWLYDLVANDQDLQEMGFTPLRELATIGYDAQYYDREALGDNPYKKMLAALWRENPVNQIASSQKLMTMAGLLHIDNDGNALVVELIKASGLSTDAWLSSYLHAYLTPLLHCFFKYKLVFMPHGENLILALENHVPVKAFMKDIGEEVCLLNVKPELPEGVERIAITMPEEMEILSIFTDVFDCIFRYLVDILDQQLGYHERNFWRVTADVIIDYQSKHPELKEVFKQHDLFAEQFELSCLNRLQLSNNKQMVDLTDPANSLQFAGYLKNPIAKFKPE
ncbi:GNAT family N-acetyltransferase [Thalassotalea euphylliae]|uniref:GNAT family N-acetyltransferase n=1 Tax=Thalassotalea euphylliae TaxID=1655234 RepID=UPI00363C48CF